MRIDYCECCGTRLTQSDLPIDALTFAHQSYRCCDCEQEIELETSEALPVAEYSDDVLSQTIREERSTNRSARWLRRRMSRTNGSGRVRRRRLHMRSSRRLSRRRVAGLPQS